MESVLWENPTKVPWLSQHINSYSTQGLQEKFYKVEQECFRTQEQADTSIKIEDLRSNKTTGKQLS
jgi:hypothetical protein